MSTGEHTLLSHRLKAQKNGDAMFMASLSYSARLLQPLHKINKWIMVITLLVMMCYLYTRSLVVTVLVVGGLCLLDAFAFAVFSWATNNSAVPIETTHSLSLALLADFVIGLLAMLFSYLIFEFTALGNRGVGSDIVLARNLQSTVRTVLVLLSTCICGYDFLHWVSAPFVLVVVWIFYLVDIGNVVEQPYSLWLAQRASILVLFMWVAFTRPWYKTYFVNALLALGGIGFVAAFVEFLFRQQ